MLKNAGLWIGMSFAFFSNYPLSLFHAGHGNAAIAALTMPIAVGPETASF
ncbi:hypothetical protein MCEREM21A_01552 [Sphingomonadaceae bacterium]